MLTTGRALTSRVKKQVRDKWGRWVLQGVQRDQGERQ